VAGNCERCNEASCSIKCEEFNTGNTDVFKTQTCEFDSRAEYVETKYVEVRIIIAIIYCANLSSSTYRRHAKVPHSQFRGPNKLCKSQICLL
jgi:hypothetical protein